MTYKLDPFICEFNPNAKALRRSVEEYLQLLIKIWAANGGFKEQFSSSVITMCREKARGVMSSHQRKERRTEISAAAFRAGRTNDTFLSNCPTGLVFA